MFGQASTLNPTVLDNASSVHAWAITKGWGGQGAPDDLLQMSSAHHDASAAMAQSNFDAQFKAQIANIQPQQLNPLGVDYSAALQRMQNYEPAFAQTDLQALLECLTADPAVTAQTLAALKQDGLSPTVQNSAVYLAKLARYAAPAESRLHFPRTWQQPNIASATYRKADNQLRDGLYRPENSRARLQAMAWQRVLMTLPSDTGGNPTGYTCADDSVAQAGFNIAAATVAVMCALSVIGTPICLPVVGLFATIGSAAWGYAHLIKCGG